MIIVDDEKNIRESMKNCVDWENLGIQLVGLCKNGLEAYDMILDESPDIVLTDIKMPALSGLELISRIVQSGQHIEFIILSGYGEFEYTKEAMKYGIKHYLLKPCNEEELVAVVKEASKACYQRRLSYGAEQENAKLLREFKGGIFRSLLLEYAFDRLEYEKLKERFEQYIQFADAKYSILVLKDVVVADLDIISSAIPEENLAACLFCVYTGGSVILISEGYRGFADNETYEQYFQRFGRSFAVKQQTFESLPDMLLCLRQLIVTDGNSRYYSRGKWPYLYNKSTVHEEIDAIKEKMIVSQDHRTALHTGKDFINQTIGYVYANLKNPELSLKYIAETVLFMNVDYLSKQFNKYVGCKFSSFLANARIEEAKRLLQEEKDISVQEVAAAVGCGNNPQYFSLLFKKHTGVTATDYMKTMRTNG